MTTLSVRLTVNPSTTTSPLRTWARSAVARVEVGATTVQISTIMATTCWCRKRSWCRQWRTWSAWSWRIREETWRALSLPPTSSRSSLTGRWVIDSHLTKAVTNSSSNSSSSSNSMRILCSWHLNRQGMTTIIYASTIDSVYKSRWQWRIKGLVNRWQVDSVCDRVVALEVSLDSLAPPLIPLEWEGGLVLCIKNNLDTLEHLPLAVLVVVLRTTGWISRSTQGRVLALEWVQSWRAWTGVAYSGEWPWIKWWRAPSIRVTVRAQASWTPQPALSSLATTAMTPAIEGAIEMKYSHQIAEVALVFSILSILLTCWLTHNNSQYSSPLSLLHVCPYIPLKANSSWIMSLWGLTKI